MSKPSDMDADERKRQYAALRRSIHRDAPPALVAKFQLASDGERLFGDGICIGVGVQCARLDVLASFVGGLFKHTLKISGSKCSKHGL